MKNITIRLDDETRSYIDRVAKLEDRSVSGLIRHTLKQYCQKALGESPEKTGSVSNTQGTPF
jgi:predicted transcriptional regulator